MHAYKAKGIRDIIAEFPGVGSILEEYGISCGPCTVGICQLKTSFRLTARQKKRKKS